MEWKKIIFYTILVYVLYYAVNIIIDFIKSKNNPNIEEEKEINFEGFEEEKPVEIQASNIKEVHTEPKEEQTNNTNNENRKEGKKKSIEKKEKEYSDDKFQSMPVSEFIRNAKLLARQVDFN